MWSQSTVSWRCTLRFLTEPEDGGILTVAASSPLDPSVSCIKHMKIYGAIFHQHFDDPTRHNINVTNIGAKDTLCVFISHIKCIGGRFQRQVKLVHILWLWIRHLGFVLLPWMVVWKMRVTLGYSLHNVITSAYESQLSIACWIFFLRLWCCCCRG